MHSKYTYVGYNPDSKEKSRQLRTVMTDQEKHLWYDFLRFYPIKFYRQRPIGNFIADFYCSKLKLAIELDGSQHYTPEGKDYDEFRTQIINTYGIKVIRFTNADIDTRFDGVCKQIDIEVEKILNE